MKKLRVLVSFVLALFLASSVLSGCFLFESIGFTKADLSVGVGETVNLDNYITIKNSSDGLYELKSDNSAIIAVVSQNTVKALKKGNATITATLNNTNKSQSIKISADYKTPASIRLQSTSDLFQKKGETIPITFTAELNEGANPATKFKWTVNGEKQSTAANNFTLDAQKNEGEYEVKVVCETYTSLSAVKTLRVYNVFDTPLLDYTGANALEQNGQAIIKAITQNPDGNPPLFTEWFVNSQLFKSEFSHNPEFLFKPDTAGKYLISAKINGETLYTGDGNDFIEIYQKGTVTPQNLSLDYTSAYPSVYLTWDNRQDAAFRIDLFKAGGGETVISSGALVNNGKFDLTSYIDLAQSYKIDVKSTGGLTGYEDIYYEGETVSYNFDGIPAKAKTYLNSRYLSKSLYMQSDDDVYDLFEYMIIFRPYSRIVSGQIQSSVTFYMGYDSELSPAKMANSFKDRLNITGSYGWQLSGTLKTGNEVTLLIVFKTAGEPTNFSTAGKRTLNPLMAPAVSHAGYNSPLPIKDKPLSPAKASTSDQLFYSVMKGLKPNVQSGSPAERIYNEAQRVLKDIIDEDMSESEIALAVYSWIMFKVTYDDLAAEIEDIETSVKQPAFYLEGVFDTGFAVCDGISKAYSLLCNMAGLDCVRIIGPAYAPPLWGQHAWNKVLIEGEWYVADATWGLETWYSYKRCSPGWFMLIDSDLYLERIEEGGIYPESSKDAYNYYAKKGLYFYHSSDWQARVETAILNLMQSYNKTYKVGTVVYNLNYYAVEFQFSPSLKNLISKKVTDILTDANIDADIFISRNIITIAVR